MSAINSATLAFLAAVTFSLSDSNRNYHLLPSYIINCPR
jgi:hypothetical protein